MTQRSELKVRAKEKMAGKYGTLILAFVIVQGLQLVSSLISGTLFPGDTVQDIVLANVFSFILSLIVNVMSAGMIYMYLNIARGKQYSLGDLVYFYKNHPDCVITASFVFSVINVLVMLPSIIYGYNIPTDTNDLNVLADSLMKSLSMVLVGLIVYEVLIIPLEMAYFLLSDHPDMKGMDALKESINLMRGNFGRYLMLKISFVPLMFLSVFTFYIALLWILPYMTMTEAMFYRDLLGEFTPQQFQCAPEETTASDLHSADSQATPDDQCEVQSVETQHIQNSTEVQDNQADTLSETQQNTSSAQEQEEDNEPKPWDEYFNRLK